MKEDETNRETAVTSDIDETMMEEIKMTLNSSKDVDSLIQWIQVISIYVCFFSNMLIKAFFTHITESCKRYG